MGTAQGTGEPRPGRVAPRDSSAVLGKDRGSLPGAGTRRKSRAPEPGAGCWRVAGRLGGDRDPPPPRRLAFRQPISRLSGCGSQAGPSQDPRGHRRETPERRWGSGLCNFPRPAPASPLPGSAQGRGSPGGSVAPGCSPGGEVEIPLGPNKAQTLTRIKCIPLLFLPHLRPVPPRFQAAHRPRGGVRTGPRCPGPEQPPRRIQAGWDLHG